MSLGASAALREGRLALQAGNFDAAAERFGAAIVQTPKAALAWVLQAEAYYRLQRWRETIAAANRALQLDGASTPAWVRLGTTHLKLGDLEEAAALVLVTRDEILWVADIPPLWAENAADHEAIDRLRRVGDGHI